MLFLFSCKSCPTLCNPTDVAHQASQAMGFPRQESWSGLLFPSAGDFPNARIEPISSESPGKAHGINAAQMWVQSLCREGPLEKKMATHSSTLAWKIPWTEEPGGLQSVGSQRVRQDWVTKQQQQQEQKTGILLLSLQHMRTQWDGDCLQAGREDSLWELNLQLCSSGMSSLWKLWDFL